MTHERWLALDIGGANLKAVHESGAVRSISFELWKRPEELSEAVTGIVNLLPESDSVALTMTAELCDCYPLKRVGVLSVLDAVARALPDRRLSVWGMDGRLSSPDLIRNRPELAAAANWLALATVAARCWTKGQKGILLDIGSTTTDLIPLVDGHVTALGRSDTERLQTGELVYAGVRRTPLCALATSVPFQGRATGVAAELFATTLDIFLTLGDISVNRDDHSTADGRPATRALSRDRLARMVGADREGFSDDEAGRLAVFFRECLLSRLQSAVRERPTVVVISGSGEFLARTLAERLLGSSAGIVSLSEQWGEAASGAACAKALLDLATE